MDFLHSWNRLPERGLRISVRRLKDKNVTVIVRYTQGEDIAAACGQLAVQIKEKSAKRTENREV